MVWIYPRFDLWLNNVSWQSYCFQSSRNDFSCPYCEDEIESRLYMIIECNHYQSERGKLINVMKKFKYKFNLQNVLDYQCNNKNKLKHDMVVEAVIEFLHQIYIKLFQNYVD